MKYESNGNANKKLLVKEYANKIEPYLRNNNLSSKI